MPKKKPRRSAIHREPRKTYQVSLPPELAARLDRACDEMGATASSAIRECVVAGLASVIQFWRDERANRSVWERERGINPEETT